MMGSSITLTILNHHIILKLKLRSTPSGAATLQMELAGTGQVYSEKLSST